MGFGGVEMCGGGSTVRCVNPARSCSDLQIRFAIVSTGHPVTLFLHALILFDVHRSVHRKCIFRNITNKMQR